MKYGYIRVSTAAQATKGYSLSEQRDAVIKAGADPAHIIEDAGISGKNLERPGMQLLRLAVREGDTVIVYSLDRLGRSMADIAALIQDWNNQGITIKTIRDGIDTSTIAGRTMAGFMAVIADTERQLILERTAKGRAAALAAGKNCTRPKTWVDRDAIKIAKLYETLTLEQIAILEHRSPMTIKAMLKRANELGIKTTPRIKTREWSDQDALHVLDMHTTQHMAYRAIAKKIGKSPQTICNMCKRANEIITTTQQDTK